MNLRPADMADPLKLMDIDAVLTDEERLLAATVRRFTEDHIRPHIGEWFEAGGFPRELFGQLGKLGVLGMHLSGYGCAGSNAVSYGLACLELEAADSGLRSAVSVQGSLAMFAIWRYGSAEQKQEWLPAMAAGESIGCFGLTEADAGSDPGSMRTRAVRDGTDWVLTGSKMWITNSPLADVAIVWARTEQGVRGFLVPRGTRGFSTPEIAHKLSLRASVTGEIVLDDVRLPAHAQLPLAEGLKAPLSCLSEARFGIVFGSVGAARDSLLAALAYAGAREQFGRPIAGFQLTQRKLADMTVDVATSALLALHLGRQKDAGRLTSAQVSVGKLHNVRTALAVARQARTILGGAGITTEYSPLRHANNLESVLTYEGTSEVHTLVIGEAITGIAAYR